MTGRMGWIILLSAALGFGGCATMITETAKKAMENRSTSDQLTDTKIATGILDRLSGKDKGLLLDVNVDVWEQRVMLTGTLESAKAAGEVASLAKADERVRNLYNEIQIVTPEEKEKRRKDKEKSRGGEESKSGAGQSVDDFWIETKLTAQLLGAKGVTSVNYRWRSVLNKVFIIGRAASGMERDLVLEVARNITGVKLVKDFIAVPVERGY